MWLRKQGQSAAATAETVGTTTETRRQWITRAVAAGLASVAVRKAGAGARPKLTAAQQAAVLAWVDATPRSTLPVLRQRIMQEWGIALSATQVWALVRARGCRRVVPRKRHYQADPVAQAAAPTTSACWPRTSPPSPPPACSSPTKPGGG